ncbi:unnamed protein product, partial [marine sediment metagenome]
DCTEENWERVIGVDLKGVWLGMKYAIPQMLKTGGGCIINTASLVGIRGGRNVPIYTAAKGGVLSLSRATCVEYAAQSIRVNCIIPGHIRTPMNAGMSESVQGAFLSAIPQGRFGQPEDVAQAALFLASDEASFINGHALAVDGGMGISMNI